MIKYRNEPGEGENAEIVDKRGVKRLREGEDETLVRDMKRLRLEEYGEKGETNQIYERMGKKLKMIRPTNTK